MAFKVDLPQIEIGVSYSHALRWSLQDENGVVTPVDLSAWEGRMQFRKKITDVVEYLDVSTANNRMVLTGNLIQIEVEASITKALVPVEDGVVDLVLWCAQKVLSI